VRQALVEAAWIMVRSPGPMPAFYQRIRGRRGHQIAIVATARKLTTLFSCLLIREQDYAYGQPSLTAKKLRRLEITAGAPRRQRRDGTWLANNALREAERQLAEQAELAYQRTVRDRQAAGLATTTGKTTKDG
jgi:transposase